MKLENLSIDFTSSSTASDIFFKFENYYRVIYFKARFENQLRNEKYNFRYR